MRHLRASQLSPVGALARGALAGAIGTAAMDAVWFARYRRGGGRQGPLAWETAEGVDGWDDVPVPGQVDAELDEATTKAVAAHVRGCWGCSSAAETARLVKRSLRRLREAQPPPLASVRLRRFAGDLDGR